MRSRCCLASLLCIGALCHDCARPLPLVASWALMMSAYDYELPASAIAQTPIEPRDSARLLVATEDGGTVVHRRVSDLPDLLEDGDLPVVNETRVLPARLPLRKETGGRVEVRRP